MTSKSHRLSACHRHPTIPVTGFCASCLSERLAGIQSPAADHHRYHSPPPPDLRRTKSLSGGRDSPSSSAAASSSESRRRSCEVRARSTLSDLFTVDDEEKKKKKRNRPNRKARLESENSGFEIREDEKHDGEEAVRVCDGRDDEEAEGETKTMKEFIDLELRNRKNATRDLRSFRKAASAFSEKLGTWRWKHKLKKRRSFGGNGNGGDVDLTGMRVVEKPRARRLRETQSEIGEYGFGRRSCDTDPRLSIDAGRTSVDNYHRLSCDAYPRLYIDESRISVDNDAYRMLSIDPGRISVDNDSRVMFDAPRASWDGCLIGKRSHKLSPMVSLVENDNDRVLVEDNSNGCPGGSTQTKDYYRGRRSFDRSSSRRRQSMAEVDELRMISNAKVSPATTELFYGAKLLISEKDLALRNENVKSFSDVQGDCVMGSASKDDALNVANGVNHKGLKKFHKLRRMWSKLGMVVQRREEDKLGEEECGAGGVLNNKPLAESWQKLRRVVNVQASESVSQKLIRSYSVSCRNPCRMAGLISSLGGAETKGNVLNGRQEFMLQRNRSVRYSPNNLDNGLLRFYLTPLKSYRRSKSGKSSLKDLQPITRSVF